MADSYQAIYDAVRSRISGCSVGEIIGDAVRNAFGNVNHQMACLHQDASCAIATVLEQQTRPFVLLKPAISKDIYSVETVWECRYSGVTGAGKTPDEASRDFDKNWKLAKT